MENNKAKVRLTRDDILETISDTLYDKTPFYKIARIIQKYNPQLTNEDIMTKYFDKFKGCVIQTDNIPRIRYKYLSYIYSNKNLTLDEEKICKSLEVYAYEEPFYVTYFYTPIRERGIILNVSEDVKTLQEIIQKIETCDKKEYAKKVLVHPSEENIGLLQEHGFSVNEINEMIIENIKEMYLVYQYGDRVNVNTRKTACCGKKYKTCFDLYVTKHGPCRFCGAFRVYENIYEKLFYDLSDLSLNPCVTCKKDTRTFRFDKDMYKIYVHKLCNYKEDSFKRKLITYNNNLIVYEERIDSRINLLQ